MKKYLFLIALLCLGLSCQNNLKQLEKNDITHIDVYYIPFGVLSPIETTEEQIKLDVHKKKIEDEEELEEIYSHLVSLRKTDNDQFIETGIYLRADFYNNDKEILRLLYDKNNFKIGSQIYEENNDLINLLIKDFKTDL